MASGVCDAAEQANCVFAENSLFRDRLTNKIHAGLRKRTATSNAGQLASPGRGDRCCSLPLIWDHRGPMHEIFVTPSDVTAATVASGKTPSILMIPP
jgi:hypothetical protein